MRYAVESTVYLLAGLLFSYGGVRLVRHRTRRDR